MSLLGNRLKELRGIRSLYEVEKATKVRRIDLSRFEQGIRTPSIKSLKALATFYDVPYPALRKLYYEDMFLEPEEREIVLDWAKEYLSG